MTNAELNARVAKFMGLRFDYHSDPELQNKCWIDSDNVPWNIEELNYSGDMNVCMGVLTKLQEEYKMVQIVSNCDGWGIEIWDFDQEKSWDTEVCIADVDHKSLPMAICLVTLELSNNKQS